MPPRPCDVVRSVLRERPQLARTLLPSSALAVLFLMARIGQTHELAYTFLAWNLFLAWVPYGCAVVIQELHARRAGTLPLVLLFAVWLGFLPNAPYLVTDFMHLRFREGAPLWFDALMVSSFAWAGVALGVASLRVCTRVVRVRAGARVATAFVAFTALLTGFGVYLGRFGRFNTWDVATHPLSLVRQVVTLVAHPRANPQAWTVTLTFALFFLVAYAAGRRAPSLVARL